MNKDKREKKHEQYLNNVFKDNWMLSRAQFGVLQELIDFKIEWDVCVDKWRSNKLVDKCFSVEDDTLKQNLQGMKFFANVPYDDAGAFIQHFEEARKNSADTKCLLMIPEWKHFKWFPKIINGNMWRIVRRYTVGDQLFSQANNQRPDMLELRKGGFSIKWNVLALVYKEKSDSDFKTYSCRQEYEKLVEIESQQPLGYSLPQLQILPQKKQFSQVSVAVGTEDICEEKVFQSATEEETNFGSHAEIGRSSLLAKDAQAQPNVSTKSGRSKTIKKPRKKVTCEHCE